LNFKKRQNVPIQINQIKTFWFCSDNKRTKSKRFGFVPIISSDIVTFVLSFRSPIPQQAERKNIYLSSLSYNKNFVNRNALKLLFYVMMHSHLSYCINIYSCAITTNLQKLRVKQKEAIRIICNAGYRDHTIPLFISKKILPLNEMVKFATLKFMHSYTHKKNKLPLSFHETWTLNLNRNPNCLLRNANDLFVPAHHFATVKRFPLFTFPLVWNEETERKYIPSHII
jgi:hypothetical protein